MWISGSVVLEYMFSTPALALVLAYLNTCWSGLYFYWHIKFIFVRYYLHCIRDDYADGWLNDWLTNRLTGWLIVWPLKFFTFSRIFWNVFLWRIYPILKKMFTSNTSPRQTNIFRLHSLHIVLFSTAFAARALVEPTMVAHFIVNTFGVCYIHIAVVTGN